VIYGKTAHISQDSIYFNKEINGLGVT